MSPPKLVLSRESSPRTIADAAAGLRHIFVRDLTLTARIGVRPQEKVGPQRIRINLDLAVVEGTRPLEDRLENVVCYDQIVTAIRRLVAAGHVNLIETLAERIASACLEREQIRTVRVRIEKLDLYEDAASVGVEIERRRP